MSNIFSAFCILVDEKALLPTAVTVAQLRVKHDK
jgi:hypothetical protein